MEFLPSDCGLLFQSGEDVIIFCESELMPLWESGYYQDEKGSVFLSGAVNQILCEMCIQSLSLSFFEKWPSPSDAFVFATWMKVGKDV